MNTWEIVSALISFTSGIFRADVTYIIVGVCTFATLLRLTLRLISPKRGI